MANHPDAAAYQESFRRLNQIRADALEHYRLAQQLHRDRQELIRHLLGEGFSQADIAREMGVSRQAVQKMLR